MQILTGNHKVAFSRMQSVSNSGGVLISNTGNINFNDRCRYAADSSSRGFYFMDKCRLENVKQNTTILQSTSTQHSHVSEKHFNNKRIYQLITVKILNIKLMKVKPRWNEQICKRKILITDCKKSNINVKRTK